MTRNFINRVIGKERIDTPKYCYISRPDIDENGCILEDRVYRMEQCNMNTTYSRDIENWDLVARRIDAIECCLYYIKQGV